MLKMKLLAIICLSLICINADAVCDLHTLKLELRQDLDDNGFLDCERVIAAKHFEEETENQKNKRLAAQWDTNCGFESRGDWKEQLRKNYDIVTITDSIGTITNKNAENQADMCEIVRAAMGKYLATFSMTLGEVSKEALDKKYEFIVQKIDCAGPLDVKDGPRICAANGGSYFQKNWSIFLYPAVIKVN
jgi:hypothetical protein